MKGRFAPSPTGYMHLGNLWIALLSYVSVRQQKGKYILRIEDIDTGRSKKIYEDALIEDLQWLGFDWDEGPLAGGSHGPYRQSERIHLYEDLLEAWRNEGSAYPCFCNRARIQSISSAPHLGETRSVYDGYCLGLDSSARQRKAQEKNPSWRVKAEDIHITFCDLFQGEQKACLYKIQDDFVLKRGDGLFSYQMAVSYDDAVMGVSEVIRGSDLLSSTALQIWLISKMGYKPPIYGHAPLLMDDKGYRLSKRQHGITIRSLKESGMSPSEIIGTLLYEIGMIKERHNLSLQDLIDYTELWQSISGDTVTLTKFDTKSIITA